MSQDIFIGVYMANTILNETAIGGRTVLPVLQKMTAMGFLIYFSIFLYLQGDLILW